VGWALSGLVRTAMKKDFQTRDELADYLRMEFPLPAARDGEISPIRGGASHAEAKLKLMEPHQYAATRNYLGGGVTGLSPFITHGVLTLRRVYENARGSDKLVSELAWRDYWQRLWLLWGDGVWQDREEYKTGLDCEAYRDELPADLVKAETGLACMDAFVGQLHQTGYLHNHARMWMAAYVVHWRRVRWQAGARWFLTHLLDGDPASNNLSWQWVASTFANKPYFFNRENLERYSEGKFCGDCPSRNQCPFDGTYETLAARLFEENRR
jgi:deoxyribodipyrimidine photo-lyase